MLTFARMWWQWMWCLTTLFILSLSNCCLHIFVSDVKSINKNNKIKFPFTLYFLQKSIVSIYFNKRDVGTDIWDAKRSQ